MFTIVYLVFTIAPLWLANKVEDHLHLGAGAIHNHVFNSTGWDWQEQIDDILAIGATTKVPKHTHVSGKRKTPRTSFADLSSRGYLHKAQTVCRFKDILPITSYKAPIFIKNRVLRI